MNGLAPKFDLLRKDWPLLAATDVPVTRKLNVTAPFNGEEIASVAVASERHIQDALFAAFAMFRQKDRRLPANQRVTVLERAIQLINENADTFALEAARESGQSVRGCAAQVQQTLACADAAINCLRRDSNELAPDAQKTDLNVAEPLGVVVAVLARNSPLVRAARVLFAAVAAGTPVIIKPAQDTPLSCLRLVQLLHESGLPYVWCQCLVIETYELVQQLITDPRVALLSFTGSSAVGWGLRSQLPPGTRCVLEHGSVAPAIVAADADLELALDAVVASGLCSSAHDGESLQRVFVPRAQAEAFAAALAKRCADLRLGDPLNTATDVGALSRPNSERVQAWVAAALAGGARLVCGGVVGSGAAAASFPPTVLFDPPIDTRLSREPVCAPVVAVYGVDDLEAACDRANALPLARSASIFTRSEATALQLFNALDASHVVLNDHIGVRCEQRAISGLRRSGLGASGVVAAVSAMQIRKYLTR